MLTKFPFYYGTTRNAVVSFAALFSDLRVVTKDANKKTQKIVKVPISYANKDKYVVRMLQADPNLNEDLQIKLPRASFEILGYSYDSQRQLNKVHKTKGSVGDSSIVQYTPVPYDLEFSLYTYTKTSEDNLQLMEQILPFFRPDMNLSVKMMQEPLLVQDIPLYLNSVTVDDQYDGSFEDRRMIITTYTFTMKLFYYGQMKNLKDGENHFEDGTTEAPIIKRVIVNVNNNKYTAEIDPFEANETDAYNIIEGWDETIPRDFDEDLKL